MPDANIMFNQFLVRGEQPLLFHTGLRALFPLVSEAIGASCHSTSSGWITFGHVEADECGSMNQFLAAAPERDRRARRDRLHGPGERPRRPRAAPARRRRDRSTSAATRFATSTRRTSRTAGTRTCSTTRRRRTLFCGDLFTRFGESPATTTDDIVEASIETEEFGAPTALTPTTAPMIRRLADLDVDTLALMHGPTYKGDCTKALLELADGYEHMLAAASA